MLLTRPRGSNSNGMRDTMVTATRSSTSATTIGANCGAPTIIEALDVVKTYRSGDVIVNALKGVSLAVPKGEMLAIMGPSGCGKTTLLNCLSGLDKVSEGVIKIADTDINRMSDRAKTTFRALNMGFIFQFYNLLPVLSAEENVELPLIVSGVDTREARRRAKDALEIVGLADWGAHRPAQLSGGQRQRVTIARALVNNPAIVWADEPTGDLDSKTADDIMTLIESLNQQHQQTFVVVTHDPGIGARCHRTIHMRDGAIEGEERR
jgi:putative ABC transport system ATP-binding protein